MYYFPPKDTISSLHWKCLQLICNVSSDLREDKDNAISKIKYIIIKEYIFADRCSSLLRWTLITFPKVWWSCCCTLPLIMVIMEMMIMNNGVDDPSGFDNTNAEFWPITHSDLKSPSVLMYTLICEMFKLICQMFTKFYRPHFFMRCSQSFASYVHILFKSSSILAPWGGRFGKARAEYFMFTGERESLM